MTPQWIAMLASVWAVAVTAVATIYPLQQRKRINEMEQELAMALGKGPDWQPRTDDARRTKGEPPPTYAQLVAKVREQEEINQFLARQRDNLIKENARLRSGICGDEAPRLRKARRPDTAPAVDDPTVDEDVTRPYVRKPIDDWMTEIRDDPWKDELR